MTQIQEEAIVIISKIIHTHPDAITPKECATLLTAIVDTPRIEYVPWTIPAPVVPQPYTQPWTATTTYSQFPNENEKAED